MSGGDALGVDGDVRKGVRQGFKRDYCTPAGSVTGRAAELDGSTGRPRPSTILEKYELYPSVCYLSSG